MPFTGSSTHAMRPVLGLLAGCALVSGALAEAPKTSDLFEKRIRPLLIEKCYGCHSPDKKIKGGLRLDSRDGWAKGGDSGPAIVPGKPEESLLLKAVAYHDRDLKMPPKQKLPDADIAALQEWITQGAPDPRTNGAVAVAKDGAPPAKADPATWWSFQPIKKPQPPAVKDNAWPHNAIDRFILAKLEASHLQPAPDAPAVVLSRRLHDDLTGLPNLPEEASGQKPEAGIPNPNPELRTQLIHSWINFWLPPSSASASPRTGWTSPVSRRAAAAAAPCPSKTPGATATT